MTWLLHVSRRNGTTHLTAGAKDFTIRAESIYILNKKIMFKTLDYGGTGKVGGQIENSRFSQRTKILK